MSITATLFILCDENLKSKTHISLQLRMQYPFNYPSNMKLLPVYAYGQMFLWRLQGPISALLRSLNYAKKTAVLTQAPNLTIKRDI